MEGACACSDLPPACAQSVVAHEHMHFCTQNVQDRARTHTHARTSCRHLGSESNSTAMLPADCKSPSWIARSNLERGGKVGKQTEGTDPVLNIVHVCHSGSGMGQRGACDC
eukprot:976003-Pelagomonas_calceolata.AAC.2